MDSIKEIFEAMGQRIRSPFWGYVFISFVLFNWKALFYVVFSDSMVEIKFSFFDENTCWQSLYLLPLVFGLFATLCSPYISEYGARWAEKPVNRKRIREVNAAHLVLKSKNRLAAERENERAIYEQSLIDQAKRDEEIDNISDPNLRDEVSAKIEDMRAANQLDEKSNFDILDSSALKATTKDNKRPSYQLNLEHDPKEIREFLNAREIQTLSLLGRAKGKVYFHELKGNGAVLDLYKPFIKNLNLNRLEVELAASLKELVKLKLAAESQGIWKLSALGYQIFDEISQ